MAAPDQERALIGLCDGEIDKKKHQTSFLTNKVGGRPDALPAVSRRRPRCSGCRAPLGLVVQVYCPLAASPYHRTLHVFACPGTACSGRPQGWAVLRSQSLDTGDTAAAVRAEGRPGAAGPPEAPEPPEPPMATTDWCDGADDWGMEDEEPAGGGLNGGVRDEGRSEDEAEAPTVNKPDVSSRLQELRLGDDEDEDEDEDEDAPVFRPFYISVVEESDLGGQDDLEHAEQLLREYENREGVAVGELQGGGGGEEEKYEKSEARHGDAVFSRFMKSISLCPEQILRYCWDGAPLFVSEPPSNVAQMVPACGSCGARRTFELQLMPALVSLMRRTDSGSEAELDFGTVLVYTCRSSCWTAGSPSPRDEFVFIQSDPDQQLFK